MTRLSAEQLKKDWNENPRWKGVTRPYTPRTSCAFAARWTSSTRSRGRAREALEYLHEKPFVNALGALTGNQAMQQVKAGLNAIYLSGWQVAGDANLAGEMYPDQSLYPVNSVPAVVRKINRTLLRADQIHHAEGNDSIDWLQPIVADAEAGFGGVLNAFELMKDMIDAGAAGVHFEDQLSSAKKCGHMGGKVLVPTSEAVSKLAAARLAADVCGVPTLLVARTDADAANLLTSTSTSATRRSSPASAPRRASSASRPGSTRRSPAASPTRPTPTSCGARPRCPDLAQAKKFAEAMHKQFPGKLLAYNCSPSFNWKKHLDDATIAKFQRELGAMGYKFQFITLAGFHALNYSMFTLAKGYRESQMSAYVELQEAEFASEKDGYTATKHQREVGAGYFDAVTQVVTAGQSSLTALAGSTEEEQFEAAH
jgi:isocitrate lyase